MKIDLLGKTFGNWTVIEEREYKRNKKYWYCECICGKKKEVYSYNLRKGTSKSCGCLERKKRKGNFKYNGYSKHGVLDEEMIGKKYGRLLVIEPTTNIGRNKAFRCICDCGETIDAKKSVLINGTKKSCGCLKNEKHGYRTTHGLSNTKLYKIFKRMKERTEDIKHPGYERYGQRGIKICPEWKKDFKNFYDWSMENGYKEGLTIERINANGNYEPSNCKWIVYTEQYYNKRNTVLIEIDGIKKTIKEWMEELNVPKHTILSKVEKGIYKKHYLYE